MQRLHVRILCISKDSHIFFFSTKITVHSLLKSIYTCTCTTMFGLQCMDVIFYGEFVYKGEVFQVPIAQNLY